MRALARAARAPFAATRVAPRRAARGRPEPRAPDPPGGRARAALRRARARIASRLGAERIATAHTRDDQAETVLLRLLPRQRARRARRDPGALAGRADRAAAAAVSRATSSSAYARAAGSRGARTPRTRRRDYARNRLRRDWLPGLARAFNPRLLRAIARSGRSTAQGVGVDRSRASRREAQRALRDEEGDGCWIDAERLGRAARGARAPRGARGAARAGGARDVSRAHLERISRFLRAARGRARRIELPGRPRARARRADGFRLGDRGASAAPGDRLLSSPNPGRLEVPCSAGAPAPHQEDDVNQQFYKNMALWVVMLRDDPPARHDAAAEQQAAPPRSPTASSSRRSRPARSSRVTIEEGHISGKDADGKDFTTLRARDLRTSCSRSSQAKGVEIDRAAEARVALLAARC